MAPYCAALAGVLRGQGDRASHNADQVSAGDGEAKAVPGGEVAQSERRRLTLQSGDLEGRDGHGGTRQVEAGRVPAERDRA